MTSLGSLISSAVAMQGPIGEKVSNDLPSQLVSGIAGQVRRDALDDRLPEQEEAVPELDHGAVVQDRARGDRAFHDGAVLRPAILEQPARAVAEPARTQSAKSSKLS